MNEEAKKAYLDKLGAHLREWGATIEVLKARISKGTAQVRIDYQKQLESWHKNEATLKEKMEKLRSSSQDGYEVAKAGAHQVWTEISKLMTTLEENKNESHK